MNQERLDVQAGFQRGRGTRDQIANMSWIMEKAKEFQKKKKSATLTMLKFTAWFKTNWKIHKEMGVPDHLARLLKNLQVKKQQL